MLKKMKSCGEHTPVHMLKREDVSLEGSEASRRAGKGKKFEPADYISGTRSNPHASGAPKRDAFYTDHGRGNHFEETEEYGHEDDVQKGSHPNLDH